MPRPASELLSKIEETGLVYLTRRHVGLIHFVTFVPNDTPSDTVAESSKQARAQSLRFMEAFDYVVALKIFAAGSLVYGAVLFILIRFQRAFFFQNRLP